MTQKEYEKKAVTAEMVMVDFDTQIEKRAGGTYEGTNIIFKAFGKVVEKGFTTKSYEFKPELRTQLEAVNKKGTLFTLNYYREVGGQFWNIDSIRRGHAAKQSPASGSSTGQTASSGGFNGGPNPAAVGQAINLAVELGLAKSYEAFTANVVRDAIDKYKTLKEEFTNNWEAATKEPSPPPVQKAAHVGHDSFPLDDDDIPF